MPVKANIEIENAKIGFRNFSGVAGKYNAEGNRNFLVFLDIDLAKVLAEDGWNVKFKAHTDPDEDQIAYMQVSANFGQYPPRIVLISNRGKTVLEEEDVKLLDWADIAKVDLVIRPYTWTMYKGTPRENHGVKAYLKSMYVTIAQNKFEEKYADLPDTGVLLLKDPDSD